MIDNPATSTRRRPSRSTPARPSSRKPAEADAYALIHRLQRRAVKSAHARARVAPPRRCYWSSDTISIAQCQQTPGRGLASGGHTRLTIAPRSVVPVHHAVLKRGAAGQLHGERVGALSDRQGPPPRVRGYTRVQLVDESSASIARTSVPLPAT